MRILALAALALGLPGTLVVGAAAAAAQEPDDTLDELSSAGIASLNGSDQIPHEISRDEHVAVVPQ